MIALQHGNWLSDIKMIMANNIGVNYSNFTYVEDCSGLIYEIGDKTILSIIPQ